MVKFPLKFDELVPPAALGKLLDVLNQPALANTVRDALQKVGLKDGSPIDQVQNAWQQARNWLETVSQRVVDLASANPAVINASGQLVQSPWTNLPVHPAVAQAVAAASVSFQDQSRLADYARQTAIRVAGAQDAAFAASLPASIESLGQLPEFNQGLVVSRTDAIRIPGFADVRQLLASGSRSLVEIGAVNGTSPADWQSALRTGKQAAVLVSPNCLERTEAAQQRGHAINAARQCHAAVIEILFDATTRRDLSEGLGFPTLQQSLSSGADLVIAPLDWFVGGPSGAIAVGSSTLVHAIRSHFDARGLALHGAALAGAAACMIERDASDMEDAGLAKLLLTSVANLSDRARRIVTQIEGTQQVRSATLSERTTKFGPAPWNRYSVPTVAVIVEPTGPASSVRKDFENPRGGPSIITSEEGGKVVIDLRLVDPSQDHLIVQALRGD